LSWKLKAWIAKGVPEMNLEAFASEPRSGSGRRPRADDIDRHVGAQLRQCRIMNGLPIYTLADLIGVTYQQANKYENGVNRIAAGRLYVIAKVLGVDVGYFFEGLEDDSPSEPTQERRVFLELARNFQNIRLRRHKEVICTLTRILADLENASEPDAWQWHRRAVLDPKRLAMAD
jgi:transcriptional regulator with XRE-family HTH domain